MQRERGELVPIGDAQFCLRTIMGFWRRKTACGKKAARSNSVRLCGGSIFDTEGEKSLQNH